MNNITSITRNDSYEEIKGNCQIRYEQIINILKNGPKTAKEVSVALKQLDFIKVDDRNCAAPRLTELEQMKYVKAIKTKKCEYTGKKVAVYQLTEEIIQKLNNNEPILFFRKKEGKNMKNNSLKQEKQLNPIYYQFDNFIIIDYLKSCLLNSKTELEKNIWKQILIDENKKMEKLYISPRKANV